MSDSTAFWESVISVSKIFPVQSDIDLASVQALETVLSRFKSYSQGYDSMVEEAL